MPKNVAKLLVESTRERIVVLGRTLYAVGRVDSDKLARAGWAELEGSSLAKAALDEIEAEQAELTARISGPKQAEQIAGQREAAAKRLREISQNRWKALVARPEGAESMLARCTAYVCAAVFRAGRLLDTATVGTDAGVLPDTLDPATVAEDLREPDEIARGDRPCYLGPIRFVPKQTDEDPEKNVVWVHRLSEEQRLTLGVIVMGLQSAAGEVTSFRGQPGAVRGDLAPGVSDGALAPRGAGADAPADSAGDPVPARRRDRGQRRDRAAGTRDPGVRRDPVR